MNKPRPHLGNPGTIQFGRANVVPLLGERARVRRTAILDNLEAHPKRPAALLSPTSQSSRFAESYKWSFPLARKVTNLNQDLTQRDVRSALMTDENVLWTQAFFDFQYRDDQSVGTRWRKSSGSQVVAGAEISRRATNSHRHKDRW